MPYHVRISTKSNPSYDEVRLDLSEEELTTRFIKPYQLGQPIVIGGKTVPPGDLERIRIHLTDQVSDALLPQIRAERAASNVVTFISDEWYVTDKGRDVTDDFITGLPGSGPAPEVQEEEGAMTEGHPRNVFVVHGRNREIRDSMFSFLRAIGLHPIEWEEAVMATGSASPYVGEILDAAFTNARAIVVLFTPDDEACLREPFRTTGDPPHETQPTPQARPNVIFEAGMAMGRCAERTVLVEIGALRPFSDVGGRHVIRLDNATQRRQELAQRLQSAGCTVNLTGTDWHRTGDFEISA